MPPMKAIAAMLSVFLLPTLLGLGSLTAQVSTSVDQYILREMASKSIPGLSLAIIENRETQLRSYGVRRAETPNTVNNNTVFEAASLSKPVFALLVLELVDEGLMDLDRPLHEYVDVDSEYGSDFFEDDSHQLITPRMVLSHTSGLPNGGSTPGRIFFTPGSEFAYSGTGFRYLSAAVEVVTRRSLDELLNEYIFTPLQMHNSSFTWRKAFADNAAWGHDADGEESREILHLEQAFLEGGLVTTISDYPKFLHHLLTRYAAGDPVIESMLNPAVLARDIEQQGQIHWSLGWGIERAGYGPRIWHTGSNGAFKSFVIVDLQAASAVLIFANAENGLEIIPGLLENTIGASALSGLYQATISGSMKR